MKIDFRRGTYVFCPNCETFTPCKAISNREFGFPKRQQISCEDINWFRRGRICLVCMQKFVSAEIEESKIHELIGIRKIVGKTNQKTARRIKRKTKWLNKKREIPKDVSYNFVRNTAWWLTHSSGYPVRAPRHASRITNTFNGLAIEFGANWFLVEVAIGRCRNEICNVIENACAGIMVEENILKKSLRLHIRGAVANYDGNEYHGYYPEGYHGLEFGAQAIDLDDGVN